MIVVQFRQFLQLLLTCCLGDLWFHFIVTCNPFRHFKSNFVEDFSDLSGILVKLNSFLRSSGWLLEVVYVELSQNCSDKVFVVGCIIFRHLVQSKIGTSRQIFVKKTCRVCSLKSLFSVAFCCQKNCRHQLSSLETAIWKNIASMSADKANCCSAKRNTTPIRIWSRSGTDIIKSFRATPWYFAAALHILPKFYTD